MASTSDDGRRWYSRRLKSVTRHHIHLPPSFLADARLYLLHFQTHIRPPRDSDQLAPSRVVDGAQCEARSRDITLRVRLESCTERLKN